MARGKSKKKLKFDIPLPGMADIDDAPAATVIEEAPVQPETKSQKSLTPEKEYLLGEEWRRDGKQFDISLQDEKEKNKYKSFDETDLLDDAKDIANNTAFEKGRVVIVWDRKCMEICYRIDPNAILVE
jgi:hypothetical protein